MTDDDGNGDDGEEVPRISGTLQNEDCSISLEVEGGPDDSLEDVEQTFNDRLGGFLGIHTKTLTEDDGTNAFD